MERMRGNSKKVIKRRKRRRAGVMKVGRTMIVIGRKCAALSTLAKANLKTCRQTKTTK